MSTRAYRKQFLDQQTSLPESEEIIVESSDAEKDSLENGPAVFKNAFDLLMEEDLDASVSEEEEAVQKKREESKNAAPIAATASSRKSRRKRNKNKGRAMQEPAAKDANHQKDAQGSKELDEIDRALLDLNMAPSTVTATEANLGSKQENTVLAELLTIRPKRMDPEAELRRMFGSHVLEQDRRPAQPGHAAVGAAGNRHRPGHQRPIARFPGRYLLCTPDQETWPAGMTQRLGLEMERLGTCPESGTQWFAFTHSLRYREVEAQFYECAATMIPESMVQLLQNFPSHTSTLLQLSYIAQQSGDHSTANAYLSRAVFTLERGFHSLFVPATVAIDRIRLSYYRAENRPFLLALFKSMRAWMRKGCWQSAFEWGKFLATLTQEEDPLAIWLVLDMLALRSGEYTWVQNIWYLPPEKARFGGKSLEWFPNWWYSVALATFQEATANKDPSTMAKSQELLVDAMLRFPWIAQRLAHRCGMTLLGEEWGPNGLGHLHFQNPLWEQGGTDASLPHGAQLLLMDVYVESAFSMWKEPEVVQWFRDTLPLAMSFLFQQPSSQPDRIRAIFESAQSYQAYTNLPASIYRHVYLSDLTSNTGGANAPVSLDRYIPAAFKSGPGSMTPWGTAQMSFLDPFPPSSLLEESYDGIMGGQKMACLEVRVGSHAQSPVDPYDRYYRRKLVHQYPQQTVPLLLSKLDHAPASREAAAETSSAQPGEPEWERLGLTREDLDVATSESGILPGGNLFSAFVQSLMPWTNMGGSSGSTGSANSSLDVMQVPGMADFILGNLRSQA